MMRLRRERARRLIGISLERGRSGSGAAWCSGFNRAFFQEPGGPMSTETTKDRVLDAVNKLPPDATIEQAMERLYFIAKVEEGLRQAHAGQVIDHEDVKRRFSK